MWRTGRPAHSLVGWNHQATTVGSRRPKVQCPALPCSPGCHVGCNPLRGGLVQSIARPNGSNKVVCLSHDANTCNKLTPQSPPIPRRPAPIPSASHPVHLTTPRTAHPSRRHKLGTAMLLASPGYSHRVPPQDAHTEPFPAAMNTARRTRGRSNSPRCVGRHLQPDKLALENDAECT